MGASQLAQLSLLHPRLLQALILIDPVIQTENPSKTFAKPSTYRRDIWPSRQEARAKFASSKFYQAWDPRVFEKWVQYGLRDLPTELYPERNESEEPGVTLTTPKSQEVFSYLRPKYNGTPGIAPERDRAVYGDMHPEDVEEGYPFYRPEPAEIFRRLPELKPPVLYIFGDQSELATPELRRKKMASTGVGVGGSGGQSEGRVKEVVLADCGHLVPFLKVKECADAAASFAVAEVTHWEQMTKEWQQRWLQKPRNRESLWNEADIESSSADETALREGASLVAGTAAAASSGSEKQLFRACQPPAAFRDSFQVLHLRDVPPHHSSSTRPHYSINRAFRVAWEPHRDVLYKLYIEDRKSLEEIMQYMREATNFTPSKRAFQTQFKRWGFPSKRKPSFRDEDLVDRVRQLWEANYSQRDMLHTLQAEGHDIKERELMRLRAKNRWLMRIPNGAKPTAADETEPRLEGQLIEGANTDESIAQPEQHPVPDDPPPDFVERQKERLQELQAISDQRWREKKRRRRTKGYAGLPPDPAGMPPRFPSETTLEESREILGLDPRQYRAIRDQFQSICDEEQIMQKTVAGIEKWQAVKDRLVRENTLLQAVMWHDTRNLQSKELALDVICTDVTKRIRTLGRRLTILESKKVLGLNPDQSRQVRGEFYEILESEYYTSKLEMGPAKWKELKDRWIAGNAYLQSVLAPGENDPTHNRKLAAMELLCRDVMKRVRDDRAKRKGTFRKKPVHPLTLAADSALQPSAPPGAPAPAPATSAYRDALPAMPYGDVQTAAPQNDLSDLQIDPNLLQVADHLGTPQISSVTPAYVRPHPNSSIYTTTKLWLGSLTGRTVRELHAMIAARYPNARAEQIYGVEKDAVGNEIPCLIEEDDELDAYLDHVQGRKAVFLALLRRA
ncbi:Clr5 domain-containing protein [Cladophialophora immunda]|nr:Clr5 domain-containing protein [Cladophialophora immunda]